MTCNDCNSGECGKDLMDKKLGAFTYNSPIYSCNGFTRNSLENDLDTIEFLAANLPDVDYILTNIVNYMFTNSLTTRDKDNDDKLYAFLYSLNFNGQRNIDVLKSVAKNYRKYGYYGLLYMGKSKKTGKDLGFAAIHPRDIVACVIDNPDKPVIRQTLCYLIKKSSVSISPYQRKALDTKDRFSYDEKQVNKIIANPEKYKEEIIVVTDKEFACVRLDTSQVFGISPLLLDRKRVELILNILDRMNYDISRNGIGTIALQAKDTLEDSISESIEQGSAFGSGEFLDISRQARDDREKAIAKSMEDIAEKLSKTEYNDAFVYSGKFDNLLQLKRDTKAVDFLDYLSMYVSPIVCQMLGVPARLFDLGKTVSNIGTYSIIDNAMKNNIIPARDAFLGQCMKVIETATGLSRVKFASYEFTNNYNYNNDITILDVYERLKSFDPDKAEQYLEKNLIV